MVNAFRSIFTLRTLIILLVFLIHVYAQPHPVGFASVSGNGLVTTTGGYGGTTVTVKNQSDLEKYANSSEKMVILIDGSITITPFGREVSVKSNKTIQGVGSKSEIVHGGFNLNAVSNVIFRNLTIRDSYLEGDYDGKLNDYDGIQIDNSHHIWIDHCHLTHGGDGLIDSRKGTTFLTVSWCILSNHNKAFGIGWTDEIKTQITIHHTWFRNTNQRNPSADNILRAHLYNNFFQNITLYGVWARAGTNMVLEHCVFDKVLHPFFMDNRGVDIGKDSENVLGGTLVSIGNIVRDNCKGKTESSGSKYDKFNPNDFYKYTLHPAEKVEELLTSCAGPQENFDCEEINTAINRSIKQVAHRYVVYNEGNRSVMMNFSGLAPVAVSIYSFDGKRLYHRSRDISANFRWKASNVGLYHLRLASKDGSVNNSKIFITD